MPESLPPRQAIGVVSDLHLSLFFLRKPGLQKSDSA